LGRPKGSKNGVKSVKSVDDVCDKPKIPKYLRTSTVHSNIERELKPSPRELDDTGIECPFCSNELKMRSILLCCDIGDIPSFTLFCDTIDCPLEKGTKKYFDTQKHAREAFSTRRVIKK